MSIQTDSLSESVSRPPAEQRVVLHNISWATYEQLLADLANQSSTRLTYDQGTLEIMSPLTEHEELNRTIAQIVEILAEELNINIRRLGSTTFKREDLIRGFEPDSCYYIQNEPQVSGKKKIDLTVDPPPDLVIEVDITSDSLNKFPIFAKLGVPEVWRHDGQRLAIHILSKEAHTQVETGIAFPLITSTDINDLLEKSNTLKSVAFAKALREWIRKKQQQG